MTTPNTTSDDVKEVSIVDYFYSLLSKRTKTRELWEESNKLCAQEPHNRAYARNCEKLGKKLDSIEEEIEKNKK